jgi:late competence protein required for DNA uptake (superfamily II DNA/RNA helicase)
MKKSNQKPIEHDVHLKYLCKKCGQIHWLSLKESSTKNFKIVCYCGYVFSVKRTSSIKILYSKTTKTLPSKKTATTTESIPNDLLSKAAQILVSYGFTNKEASDLISKTYSLNPTQDIASLVKQSLSILRN